MISLNKKEQSFKWLCNKLLKIYTPFFAAFWFCFVCNSVLNPEKNMSWTETILDLLTVSLPNQTSWFPKVILLCFLIHWLAVKLFPNRRMQVAAVTAALGVYAAVMWKIGFANCWYNSVLCYALGIAVSELRAFASSRHDEFLRRKYLYISIMLAIFMVFAVGARYKGVVQPICAFAFSILCYIYTMAFSVKTRFLAWVGNNSFEFYLFHVACVQVLCKLTEVNQYLYAAGVITASVLTVYLYLQGKRLIKKAH